MFLKCANPDCEAPFKFRTGRLSYLKVSENPGAHRVHHYWLCATCSKVYTLKMSGHEPKLHHMRTHAA